MVCIIDLSTREISILYNLLSKKIIELRRNKKDDEEEILELLELQTKLSE